MITLLLNGMASNPDLDDLLKQALSENPLPPAKPPRLRRSRVTAQQLSEDYLGRLEDRRRSRLSLEDDHMDAMRFRWWFAQLKDLTLDDWRKNIDRKILENSDAKA